MIVQPSIGKVNPGNRIQSSAGKLLVLGILICFLAAACDRQSVPPQATTSVPSPVLQGSPSPSPTSMENVIQGTISIWHSWEEQKMPALLRPIADFQEKHPSVQFDVQYVPSIDLKAAYEAASVDGYAPTILIGPGEWGPELFDAGWVIDLSGYSPSDFFSDLNPAALNAARYRQALVGIPVSIEGVVLYRNQAIISFAPRTFSELINQALLATEGDVRGAFLERSFYYSGAHLYGIGGSLVSSDGLPEFNNEYGLDWVNLLQKFATAGLTEFSGDRDLQYFMGGRAGMIIESSQRRNELSEILGSANLAIDPWPALERGAMSGFVQTENLFLNPRALDEKGRISWLFIESMLMPQAQLAMLDTASIPALTVDAFEANHILIEDDLIRQAMIALSGGTAYPLLPEMAVYSPIMDDALQSIFVENTPPDQGLKAAEETISAALAGLKRSITPNP